MVDMAFLKKKDLNNGILSYRRKKTGQQLLIKWEPCMQEIVDRYNIPGSPYLLSVIDRPGTDERKQYINASHRINRHLKVLGKELGMSVPWPITWRAIPGQRGPEQEHPDFGDQRGYGTRFGDNNEDLPGLAGYRHHWQGKQVDFEILADIIEYWTKGYSGGIGVDSVKTIDFVISLLMYMPQN